MAKKNPNLNFNYFCACK